jgi:hypothetical protein
MMGAGLVLGLERVRVKLRAWTRACLGNGLGLWLC